MNWLVRTFSCSVAKKQFMAVTGLAFCLFLTTHLIGNMFVYGGKDAFNSYVEHLHALGVLVHIAEAGLIVFALIHIGTALILYFQNLAARPVRYKKKSNAGGRTLASATMPYTGLFILVFIVVHLVSMKFADHSTLTTFDVTASVLAKPAYLVFYIVSMVVVAFHVNHGFWSAFQSFGASHPKYMPIVRGFGILFSVIIGVGFGFIPIAINMVS
ncbi:MAG: succinate dehydrogenase [Desulfobacter postgatei]|uniref:Succinate dehydrogenase n=1 Tax=Desulfobacter postgatei TaxID=2293 RepID=A0A2G6MTV8_9BACT|nr:MAG: succinate dehydrogenase [Desulfobacter postgatei]